MPLLGICLAVLIVCELPRRIQQNIGTWSSVPYIETYIEQRQTADELRSFLRPGEEVVQLSGDPQFYFYLHQTSPIAVLLPTHLAGPLADRLTTRVVADLEHKRPELLVFDKMFAKELSDPRITAQIAREYVACPFHHTYGRFQLYMLRGGSIEQRLAPAAVR